MSESLQYPTISNPASVPSKDAASIAPAQFPTINIHRWMNDGARFASTHPNSTLPCPTALMRSKSSVFSGITTLAPHMHGLHIVSTGRSLLLEDTSESLVCPGHHLPGASVWRYWKENHDVMEEGNLVVKEELVPGKVNEKGALLISRYRDTVVGTTIPPFTFFTVVTPNHCGVTFIARPGGFDGTILLEKVSSTVYRLPALSPGQGSTGNGLFWISGPECHEQTLRSGIPVNRQVTVVGPETVKLRSIVR